MEILFYRFTKEKLETAVPVPQQLPESLRKWTSAVMISELHRVSLPEHISGSLNVAEIRVNYYRNDDTCVREARGRFPKDISHNFPNNKSGSSSRECSLSKKKKRSQNSPHNLADAINSGVK